MNWFPFLENVLFPVHIQYPDGTSVADESLADIKNIILCILSLHLNKGTIHDPHFTLTFEKKPTHLAKKFLFLRQGSPLSCHVKYVVTVIPKNPRVTYKKVSTEEKLTVLKALKRAYPEIQTPSRVIIKRKLDPYSNNFIKE